MADREEARRWLHREGFRDPDGRSPLVWTDAEVERKLARIQAAPADFTRGVRELAQAMQPPLPGGLPRGLADFFRHLRHTEGRPLELDRLQQELIRRHFGPEP